MLAGTIPVQIVMPRSYLRAHLELIVNHLLLHWWLHLLLSDSGHKLVREWCQSADFIYRKGEAREIKLYLERD